MLHGFITPVAFKSVCVKTQNVCFKNLIQKLSDVLILVGDKFGKYFRHNCGGARMLKLKMLIFIVHMKVPGPKSLKLH